MSSQASSPTPYHHGALREALLISAREMLATRGPHGFSLSALAREVGVSTAAPYRHFENRDDLLCVLADEGYVIFGEMMNDAAASTSEPRARLERLGLAYLEFAALHPAVFQIMFRGTRGRPHTVGPQTFTPLVEAIAAAQATGDLDADTSTLVYARNIWALMHGLALLSQNDGLAKLNLEDTPQRLVTEALEPLFR